MNIPLLCFTDGRADCLLRTIESLEQFVNGMLYPLLLVDDSENVGYGKWLDENFADFRVIHNPKRLGFAGTVQRGLSLLPKDTDFVFWLEDDFIFHRSVYIDELVNVLESHVELAQIVLKRQPVNSDEKRAGGIVEWHPDEFTERHANGLTWTEHTRNFSTNPNLTPYRITQLGWPPAPDSERKFSQMLIQNGYKFAYWEGKFSDPIVEHIGEQRIGTGY